MLFVVGSVADILDGALARAASKGTVFGAFLDSTFDRVGEAAMLAAIGLAFMRDDNEIALVASFAAVIGSFLVSYTRAKAEAIGLRGDIGFGSRVERVVLISVGLFFAPWGWLQWPIYVLAALAWLTVAQRILFVRRQLRELAEQSEGVEIASRVPPSCKTTRRWVSHGDREAGSSRPANIQKARRRGEEREHARASPRGNEARPRQAGGPRPARAADVPDMRWMTERVSSCTRPAKKRHIRGRSKMGKWDLVRALRA